jgi:4-amino-4-deoxy-L-arabinose transferase-like glycosyltransferase
MIETSGARLSAFSVRNAAWLLAALWLAMWIARLHSGDDLTIRDQQRQCAYILDAWSNGRWSAQTDVSADMASKPPLYNWLGAAAVAAAGPGHLAFSAPAALSALLLSLLAWYWGRRLSGPVVGLLAGLFMLLPMFGPKMVAYVRTDGLFTATVALTAYAWWRHWEHRGGWWWPWLAAAAATLAKGPLGLLLGSFGLIAVAWRGGSPPGSAAADSDDRRFLSRWWPAGLAIYLLLAGGWLLWAWSEWGQPLIDRMIFRELIGHAVASRDASGGLSSQFWKPLFYLLTRTAPWCVFTVLALIQVFRHPALQPAPRRAERFLACWLLAGLAAFSLGSHQRSDLIWPLVLPAAILAAREIVRRAAQWPVWARTWLGPVLFALTAAAVVTAKFEARPPRSSVRAAALAHAIAAGPGREFPLSYAVRYATQAHLGIQRYYATREQSVAALAGVPAVFVAVEDPAAVIEEVAAAGGRASLLLQAKGGWGVVANRDRWESGPGLKLLMGPVEIEVGNAEWRALQGRRLWLVPDSGGMPTVTIVNDGPHSEPFSIRLEGTAADLPLQVPPRTEVRATWRKGSGWRQVAEATGRPVPDASRRQ